MATAVPIAAPDDSKCDNPECTVYGNSSNVGLRTCSACKNAWYCSVACQRSHWKSHKPRCLVTRNAKQHAKDVGQKREFSLFNQWKTHMRSRGTLQYVLLSSLGLSSLMRMESEKQCIGLNLAFDYNRRTFLPTEKPCILPIELLRPDQSEAISAAYTTGFPEKKPGYFHVVTLLMVEGMPIGAFMPMAMEKPDTPMTTVEWGDLMMLLRETKLSSSKFSKWYAPLNANLKTQLQGAIRESEAFQPFLVNALHIESTKSLHKTHVVVVEMDMSFGLGEIKNLVTFRVDKVADVLNGLEENSGLSSEAIAYHKTHSFDLDNSPALVQSRIHRPNNALLPVMFYSKYSDGMLIMPNLIEIEPNHVIRSPKKCDQKARQAFCMLQKVTLPVVKSPELH